MLLVAACGDDDDGDAASGSDLQSADMEMDFIFYGNHAPFALAEENGYYEDEGLDMSILPGEGSTTTIQQVRTGQVDVGYLSPLSLIQAKVEDPSLDIVVVAQIMQHAPWVAAYIEGRDISSPSDLAGKSWGGTPGGPDAAFYEGYMNANGYELGEFVAIDDTYPALLAGNIDVAPAPLTSYAALELAAEDAGETAAYFSLTEGEGESLDHYNWGLAVARETLDEDPELVRAAVAASLRGWNEAINDPDAAVEAMETLSPEQDPEATLQQVEVSVEFAQSDDACMEGLGYSNPEMWEQTVNLAMEHLEIEGEAPDPTSLYTNDFLPEEPIIPSDC